jgi:hypothetical protein
VGCASQSSDGWRLAFSDSGAADWKDKWFLEGEKATVINTELGMLFSAGPTPMEDESHAVLWTKSIFEGDLKVEYRYTRLDTMTSVDAVNILYIQASGLGTEASPIDIEQSSWKRAVPAMSEYYLNMRALQISYATTGPRRAHYVSARHYPASSIESFPTETQLLPLYEDVMLFEPGVSYSITAVKEDGQLSFTVSGDSVDRRFVWDTTGFPPVAAGRVGLRHMWARSARYSDLKVYVRDDGDVTPTS